VKLFRYLLLVVLLAPAARARGEETRPPSTAKAPELILFHFPGVGGHRWIDDSFTRGLLEGGVNAEVRIVDWTEPRGQGLVALGNYQANRAAATEIAGRIAELAHNSNGTRFILTGHSGGCAIVAWVLEDLPAGVKVEDAIMMAPALSPGYDLSRSLARLEGKLLVFYSPLDRIVLGAGTRALGTMDRVQSESAGLHGFVRPEDADVALYERRLEQVAYDAQWVRLGNIGDHIGCMMRPFVREIVAPRLLAVRKE
jgi:pimeloyl-ACP methyl ester carboxylesterase